MKAYLRVVAPLWLILLVVLGQTACPFHSLRQRVVASQVTAGGLQKWALVIGIRGYPHFHEPLQFADKDAEAFSEFIQTPTGGGFHKANIRLLRNAEADRLAILDGIEWLGRNVSSEDLVYIFFSGHGQPDRQGRNYLMPYDGDEIKPYVLGFRADQFLQILRDFLDPKYLVLFVDACHAGAVLTENGAQKGTDDNVTSSLEKEWKKIFGTQQGTWMGFFAASSHQKSWEDKEFKHGLFTYYLLEAMLKAAKPQADGSVRAGEVRRYIEQSVEERSRRFPTQQTPIVSPSFDPGFPLALRRRPTPFPTPPPAVISKLPEAQPQPLSPPPAPPIEAREGAQHTTINQGLLTPLQRQIDATKDDDPRKPNLLFRMADQLFRLGTLDPNPASSLYCEAAPIYTKLIKLDPRGDKLRDIARIKEAARKAVLSWTKCASDPEWDKSERQKRELTIEQRKSAEERLAPIPIPEQQQSMIDAFGAYIKYVPESADLAEIKYRQAYVLYSYNNFDSAIPLFYELAGSNLKSKFALFSARALLRCLTAKLQFEKKYTIENTSILENMISKFETVPDFVKDQEFYQLLSSLRSSLLRHSIEKSCQMIDDRECAVLYLQLAERYPDDPNLDQFLYNAAINLRKARLIGLSIAAYDKLVATRPSSPLARLALYRVGQNYQSIAAYREAAQKYEAFATNFPEEIANGDEADVSKHIDAPWALQQAAFFRRSLGEATASIADVNLFLRNYGSRRALLERAASVFFEMGQIFEQHKDTASLKAHYREYLKQWAHAGGIERQIIAEVRLGEIAWRESCPTPGDEFTGICMVPEHVAGDPSSIKKSRKFKKRKHPRTMHIECRPGIRSQLVRYDREPALVDEAMVHFGHALQLYRKDSGAARAPKLEPSARESRVGSVTYFVAQARMAQGDHEYEQFLSMKPPSDLIFNRSQKRNFEVSTKQFRAWIEEKTRRLNEIHGIYQDVIRLGEPHWAIAAGARIGQLYQGFVNGLYTGVEVAVPPVRSSKERKFVQKVQGIRDTYCEAITSTAESIEKKAEEAFSACLGMSTELNWFNEWSHSCEAQLNQLNPLDYPLASEIRVLPGTHTLFQFDEAPVLFGEIPKDSIDEVAIRYTSTRKELSARRPVPLVLSASECRSFAAEFTAAADKVKEREAEGLFNAGVVYQQCGMKQDAERLYRQALSKKSKFQLAINNLVVMAQEMSRTQDAISQFDSIIKIDPRSPQAVQAYNNRGALLFEQAKQSNDKSGLDVAIGAARRALALDGKSMAAYQLLAQIYVYSTAAKPSMLNLAQLVCGEAGKIDNHYAPIYHTLGMINLAKRDVTGAMAAFREATTLNPELLEAQLNIGAISLSTRNYQQAEDAFQTILKKQPKNLDATIGMGVAARGQRHIDEAESWYTKAAQLEPSNCPILYNLAVLYQDYKSGTNDEIKKSRELFNRYLNCEQSDSEHRNDAMLRIKAINEAIIAIEAKKKINAPTIP